MIQSYKDYKEYYKTDLLMTGIFHRSFMYHFVDCRYKFYRSLRLTEYAINCFPGPFGIVKKYLSVRHARLCSKLQWSIPPNVCDKGLCIVHVGTVVISPLAKIGANCRIHVGANIGNAITHGESGAPTIGNNVYIGPGAKVFGPVIIGNKTVIGANAVVNKSFAEGNVTIAGVPAYVISHNNSDVYIGKEQDK